MPEVKPIWIDGHYSKYADAYKAAQEGLHGGNLEGVPMQALTLDQLKAWLTAEQKRYEFEGCLTIANLLTQVRAWKEGT